LEDGLYGNNDETIFQNVWETPDPNPSKIKCLVPAFFRDRLVDKEGGLRVYKPCFEELGDQRHFCKRLRTFKIQIKKFKTYSG
jgi:hypothetical protein